MLDDPLARKTMSPKDMLNTAWFLHSATSTYKHLSATIPILIVQGAQDHVLVPASAKAIFREVKSTDKQMVTLPDSGHIILQTTKIKPAARDAVTNWLTQHADGLPQSANEFTKK